MISQRSSIFILARDNFTELTKTPWAGDLISKIKFPDRSSKKIGESWEFSFDPNMPSKIAGEQITLANALVASKTTLKSRAGDWLVKLVNAAEPLSVQVHPPNGHRSLREDECGKFESWFIVESAPGAGVYLGLNNGVTERDIRAALATASPDLEPLLRFFPVAAGDYINVPPGTVHAVGPGTVILEPQVVVPGKSAKTLRLWDWNRKYDSTGNPSPSGRPRETHLEDALAVMQSNAGDPRRLFVTPEVSWPRKQMTMKAFPASEIYRLTMLEITDTLTCSVKCGDFFCLVLEGSVTANGHHILQGTSFFAPSQTLALACNSEKARLAIISDGAEPPPTVT